MDARPRESKNSGVNSLIAREWTDSKSGKGKGKIYCQIFCLPVVRGNRIGKPSHIEN